MSHKINMCQWSIHESFHLFNAFRTTALNRVCIKDIVYSIEDKILLVSLLALKNQIHLL